MSDCREQAQQCQHWCGYISVSWWISWSCYTSWWLQICCKWLHHVFTLWLWNWYSIKTDLHNIASTSSLPCGGYICMHAHIFTLCRKLVCPTIRRFRCWISIPEEHQCLGMFWSLSLEWTLMSAIQPSSMYYSLIPIVTSSITSECSVSLSLCIFGMLTVLIKALYTYILYTVAISRPDRQGGPTCIIVLYGHSIR